MGHMRGQEEKKECPSEFSCSITHEIMSEPTVIASGHTYEKNAIVLWFSRHDNDPNTGRHLTHAEKKILLPNHALRSLIMEWKAQNSPSERKRENESDRIEAVEERKPVDIVERQPVDVIVQRSDLPVVRRENLEVIPPHSPRYFGRNREDPSRHRSGLQASANRQWINSLRNGR